MVLVNQILTLFNGLYQALALKKIAILLEVINYKKKRPGLLKNYKYKLLKTINEKDKIS